MAYRASRRDWLRTMALGLPCASVCLAQDAAQGKKEEFPAPPPIPEVKLLPDLTTVPVRRGDPEFNWHSVNIMVLPREKAGLWVLDFAYKPIRLRTVEVPGKGRRHIHYLYYRVVNRTGKPRAFTPEFFLVTETGKKYRDTVLPGAVKVIETREDPTKMLRGAVDMMGILPPSGRKEGIDDAVFGVAMWENIDPKADVYNVYVRGLSDGMKEIKNPDGKMVTRYKTLRLGFLKIGDDRDLNENEIKLLDPPYEWIYW